MNKTILIVDDDPKISGLIDFQLRKYGYATQMVSSGKEAVQYVKELHPLLVLLDVHLRGMDGLEILKTIKNQNGSKIIMITGDSDIKLAVQCMKMGALDFLTKPIVFPELHQKVKQILDSTDEKYRLPQRKELGEKYKYKNLMGASRAMAQVFEVIEIAAQSDVNVLIEGESGTGKELVARAIHFSGARKGSPFVPVNCGAIPENLLESELFGHEKGAFTGAVNRKIGKFETAGSGTIFLDEIGDLNATLQVKLLRVLQEREIERVGGDQMIPIDGRFIVATHRDLKKLVAEGTFREDLYFRIDVFPIRIAALRERPEDIPELLNYFIGERRGSKNVTIEKKAMEQLISYSWPGNVREVENFIERMLLIKKEDDVINEEDVSVLEMSAINGPVSPVETEKIMIQNAIKESGGNITKASRLLQISRDTFYRKMKELSIEHR